MKKSFPFQTGSFFLVALGLSALFVLTSNSFTYEQALVRGFSDVIEYMAAATAPDFDSLHNLSLTHAMHRLERWPLHFAIGRLALVFNLNIWDLERIFVLLGMGTVFILIDGLRIGLGQKSAMYALLIFSPYTFRQYYAIPGMLSDCYFYVAILGIAVGMWKKHWLTIACSLGCACFIRQTGMLLLPIVAFYCYAERLHLTKAVGILLFGIVTFGLSKLLSTWAFAPVAGGYVAMHTLGIFFWVAENPQWMDFIDFMGRYGVMLFSLSPILLLTDRLTKREWMYVAFFFFLHTQPLLAGPSVSGSNVDRLAIYGLPFLALLIIQSPNQIIAIYLFMILMFLESLLPNFSLLRDVINPREYFVSVILLATSITLWYRIARLRQ